MCPIEPRALIKITEASDDKLIGHVGLCCAIMLTTDINKKEALERCLGSGLVKLVHYIREAPQNYHEWHPKLIAVTSSDSCVLARIFARLAPLCVSAWCGAVQQGLA